jgi:two-component system, NtrC family, response regulator AtoC
MPDQNITVLLVDDEDILREVVRSGLEESEDGDFTIIEAATGKDAITALSNKPLPDVVLLDHYLTDMEGTDVLQHMLDHGIDVPVILVTGKGKATNTIRATQLGAAAFMMKPYTIPEAAIIIDRVLRQSRQRRENDAAEMPDTDPTEKIIGRSPQMLEIFQLIGMVARSNKTVLITGENGTGKTLLAETIHLASDRRRGPYHAVNCAGIPETLLEGELFGWKKGTFTGANTDRVGWFESSNKGTIFLDEIGEMSPAMQSKLLTVLQSHVVTRLGTTESIKIDVRIITATNKNLSQEVTEGRFRQDLFYRLSVFPIHMPALRERKEDIPLLVAHFIDIHRLNPTTPPSRISNEALAMLTEHDWPGNVRELENVIQRAVILSRGELILPDHIVFSGDIANFTLDIGRKVRERTPLNTILQETRATAVRAALRLSENQPYRAAEMLGITPEEFTALRTELGI